MSTHPHQHQAPIPGHQGDDYHLGVEIEDKAALGAEELFGIAGFEQTLFQEAAAPGAKFIFFCLYSGHNN